MAIRIALDAGHGGSDPGAQYRGRMEKDDVLELAKAVGNILERNGIEVFYVRQDDEYETPFKKATDANNADADYYVSLHRNASEFNNQYSGIETLVYSDDGVRADLARSINDELEDVGFTNIGVSERPNLVVLRRTKMPSVLVEVGFINTDTDNELFDERFDDIAEAIAEGILNVVEPDDYNPNTNTNPNTNANPNTITTTTAVAVADITAPALDTDDYMPYTDNETYEFPEKLYRVQVGAYRNKENADRLLNSLLIEGFPAFIVYDDGYYKVQSGAFEFLANAIKMEQRLRRFRYNTYIVHS